MLNNTALNMAINDNIDGRLVFRSSLEDHDKLMANFLKLKGDIQLQNHFPHFRDLYGG